MATEGAGQRVLVVDDNAPMRDALSVTLQFAGYVVVAVPDGEAALAALGQGPLPAVIVLDLMMPVMDGWEFRRRQLADPALAAIPVIVLSGDAYARGIRETGVHDVLLKPVDFDRLLESLETAIVLSALRADS